MCPLGVPAAFVFVLVLINNNVQMVQGEKVWQQFHLIFVTKSVLESMVEKQVDTMTCLVMCDSSFEEQEPMELDGP